MADLPDVRPGQVWADNDKRSRGRTLKVVAVVDGKATCLVLTDAAFGVHRSTVGSITRISLKRFRPNSTGYRLVEPVVEEHPEPVAAANHP